MIAAGFAAILLLLHGTAETVVLLAFVVAIIVGLEIADRRSAQDASTGSEPDKWDLVVMAVVAFVVFRVLESDEAELIAVVVLVPLAGFATHLARRRLAAPDH